MKPVRNIKKEPYAEPELRDIAPVSTVAVFGNSGEGEEEEEGEQE